MSVIRRFRGDPGEVRVSYIATWILLAALWVQVLLSMLMATTLGLEPWQRVLGIAGTTIAMGLFVRWQVRAGSGREAQDLRLGLALTFLGPLLAHVASTWPLMVLGPTILLTRLVVPRVLLLVLLGLVAVTMFSAGLRDPLRPDLTSVMEATTTMVAIALGVVMLTSLTRMAAILTELRATREHLARLSVDEERRRISRDLHDVMGRTLVTASLRNETALRLIDHDPAAAKGQLEHVHDTVARGQAQLRALTTGPVVTGLSDEIDSAGTLCRRLEVGFETDVDDLSSPDGDAQESHERELLAALVVRESVTNMLKHARPTTCRVAARREGGTDVVVSVVNDGAGEASPVGGGGTGLRDLAARAEARGGSLTADHLPGGRFRVLLRLPDDRWGNDRRDC